MTADGNPRRLVIRKSSRVGYTAAAVAASLYAVVHARRHVNWHQPTDLDARQFSKDELRPAIRHCLPAMAALDEALGSDRRVDAMLNMKLAGKTLRVAGSVAATAFRRFSSDLAILDEVSAYAPEVGREGSPIRLAERAIRNSPFKRLVVGSTPNERETCLITREWEATSLKMEYAVECPHCGAAAPLAWSDLHSLSSEEAADDDERAASARMACRSCGSLWGHERLPAACEAGRWQARGDGRWAGHWMDEGGTRPILRDGNGVARPWPIAVAMSIWGGYSLSASWADMVEAT